MCQDVGRRAAGGAGARGVEVAGVGLVSPRQATRSCVRSGGGERARADPPDATDDRARGARLRHPTRDRHARRRRSYVHGTGVATSLSRQPIPYYIGARNVDR